MTTAFQLHERIRTVRTTARLTQKQVGDACDPPVSKAAVCLWESENPDLRTTPSRKQLMTLANLANVQPDLLISEETTVFQDWIVEIETPTNPSDGQILALLDMFRAIPAAARRRVIEFAQQEYNAIQR